MSVGNKFSIDHFEVGRKKNCIARHKDAKAGTLKDAAMEIPESK